MKHLTEENCLGCQQKEALNDALYEENKQLREKCEELLKAIAQETNDAADVRAENDKLRERNERMRGALKPLLEWAEANHEMPNYSEVIANAREALAGEGDE